MKIAKTHTYAASAERVGAMLADPAFHEEVAQASHAVSSKVDVTAEGDGFVATSVRHLSTEGMNLPSFVNADTLTVTTEQRWSAPGPDGSRTGSLTVSVSGLPGGYTAALALTPSGDACVESVEGDLTVSIPLVGRKVEQAAAPAIEGGIDVEGRTGDRWLADHA